MIKYALHTRMALVSIGLLALASASADEQELAEVRSKVASMFDEIEADHIQPSPVDGWYTIRKGAIVAYISGDGRYLMQGDMIDLDRQVNLSENERNKARVEMMAAVPGADKIRFTPETVKYTVSVFTDIDCGYCRKLHAQIDEYLAAGIEVQYLLYPRSGPDSGSWLKAERVWCADDRGEALTLAKLDQSFTTHDCDASMIDRHYSMGRDVGLTGTPAIVLSDGTLMPGYLPPDRLLQRLVMVESVAGN